LFSISIVSSPFVSEITGSFFWCRDEFEEEFEISMISSPLLSSIIGSFLFYYTALIDVGDLFLAKFVTFTD